MKRFKTSFKSISFFPEYQENLPFQLVISLTTSPSRIQTSLPKVLQQLQGFTSNIFVTIPKLFRNQEKYPTTSMEFIHVIEKDLGPITKILPILETFQDNINTVVVSIDDDILYNPKDIIDLAKTAYESQTICTGFARYDHVLGIWIPFGSDAIAYPIHQKTRDFVQTCYRLLENNHACHLHDDMILAYAASLHEFGQPIIQHVERKLLIQSFDDNALMYEFPNKDQECSSELLFTNI